MEKWGEKPRESVTVKPVFRMSQHSTRGKLFLPEPETCIAWRRCTHLRMPRMVGLCPSPDAGFFVYIGVYMKKRQLYLSSIGADAPDTASAYGLGLELAQFCTAAFMDDPETAGSLFAQDAGCAAFLQESLNACLRASDRFVLHGPFNELTPAAIDPLVLEITEKRYRQAIEKALGLHCPKLVLHAGFIPLVYYPEWFLSRSVSFWKRLIDDVPQTLTVCLENVMEPVSSMLLGIVQQVDDPRLRICLDLGHAHTSASQEAPEHWLRACAPYLSHIHLHNNDGVHDLHAPLFDGTMDIASLLRLQAELCPDASVTLELAACRDSVVWLTEQGLLED